MIEAITRDDLIAHARDLREHPTDEVAWCPPETLEAHPLGFMIYPERSFCTCSIEYGELPGRVCAFCDPEIDVEGWIGPVIASVSLCNGSTMTELATSASVARSIHRDRLTFMVAVPWYGVTIE